MITAVSRETSQMGFSSDRREQRAGSERERQWFISPNVCHKPHASETLCFILHRPQIQLREALLSSLSKKFR